MACVAHNGVVYLSSPLLITSPDCASNWGPVPLIVPTNRQLTAVRWTSHCECRYMTDKTEENIG